MEKLYRLLTHGSIEDAIEELELRSNPVLALAVYDSPEALSGFQDWVDQNGYSPLLLEEVEPDAEPRFGNDHLLLQPYDGKWYLLMQERGRICHCISISESRSEALRSTAAEDWKWFLVALKRINANGA